MRMYTHAHTHTHTHTRARARARTLTNINYATRHPLVKSESLGGPSSELKADVVQRADPGSMCASSNLSQFHRSLPVSCVILTLNLLWVRHTKRTHTCLDLGYNGTGTQRYTMGLGYSGTWGTTELGHNGILELGHKGTWGTTGLGHCVTVPVSDSRCVPAPLNTCPRLMIRVRVQLGL